MSTTYVTLSTPLGEGGIHIIELIGPGVPQLILKTFKPKRSAWSGRLEPHRLYLGHIYDNDEPVDEVIINFVPAKESFTGLDTVEINSHGGIMPAKKIMTLLGTQGAKKITTGQLHRLALKHQRLDKTQTEALEALQSAPTPFTAQVLLDQYNGALSREIRQILGRAGIKQSILLNKLNQLLTSARLGLALTTPRKIVIGGLPNVGKSTLFNALVGQEKVIVHHLPGTTRDVVEELISINGIPFSLRDTAGLNDLKTITTPQELIEKEGVKKARSQVKTADLIIFLLDGSQPLSRDISKVMKLLRNRPADRVGSPILYVLNKNDLPQRLEDTKNSSGLSDLVVNSAISISALHQRGLAKLRNSVLETLQLSPALYKPGQPLVFTQRQYSLLSQVYQVISKSKTKKSLSQGRSKLVRLIRSNTVK